MARGRAGDAPAPALEMTKWFDTNYHYLVPELSPGPGVPPGLATSRSPSWPRRGPPASPPNRCCSARSPSSCWQEPTADDLAAVAARRAAAGLRRGHPARSRPSGAEWIQLDEPALVLDRTPDELAAVERAYAALAEAKGAGQAPAADHLRARRRGLPDAGRAAGRRHRPRLRPRPREPRPDRAPWLPGRQVAGGRAWSTGATSGRNDLDRLARPARSIQDACPGERLMVSASCSLLHVPLRRRGWNTSSTRRCGPGSPSPSRSWTRSSP